MYGRGNWKWPSANFGGRGTIVFVIPVDGRSLVVVVEFLVVLGNANMFFLMVACRRNSYTPVVETQEVKMLTDYPGCIRLSFMGCGNIAQIGIKKKKCAVYS